MDKLLESFYGLIPRSCEPLNCDDYRVANLVMVQIPEYLASYYEINRTGATTESSSNASKQEIDPDERGPLSYLARYVVSKLHKTCVKSTDKNINLFDNNELFTSEVFMGKYYHVSRCQSSTTQTLLLGIVIRLYLKVRSFS